MRVDFNIFENNHHQVVEAEVIIQPKEEEECEYSPSCPDGWYEFINPASNKKPKTTVCLKSLGMSSFDDNLCTAVGTSRLQSSLQLSPIDFKHTLTTYLDGSKSRDI